IGGGAGLVAQLLEAELCPTAQQLTNQGSVEHLAERVREDGFRTARIADGIDERLKAVERRGIDVRDEDIAHPAERLIDVLEIAMNDRRRAAKKGSPRATAVARAAARRRQRLAKGAPKTFAAGVLVA